MNNARVGIQDITVEFLAAATAAVYALSRVAKHLSADKASRSESVARSDIVDGLRLEVERYRQLNRIILEEFERAQVDLVNLRREVGALRSQVDSLLEKR